MSLIGTFASMSMADLIQWARTAQRTGIITVRNPADNSSRKIYLHAGQIVACASNDPRDFYGNYLQRLGYCSEEDLDRALQIQRETGIMVAQILVMVEKLKLEDAVSTLTEKTIDTLCEVFLWEDGSFEYDPRPIAPRKLIEISIDPISVALEGVRRLDGWNQLRTLHPADAVFEATGKTFSAEGGAYENPRVAQVVLATMDGDRSVDQISDDVPFSAYLVLEAVSELLREGLARPSAGGVPADRQHRLENKFAEAMVAERRGNWETALQILEGLEATREEVPGLADALSRAREKYKSSVYETVFRREDVPVVAIGMEALEGLKLTPADGFVVSRVDGRLNVAGIVRISSLPEVEALRILKRLLLAKVIDFPTRRKGGAKGETAK